MKLISMTDFVLEIQSEIGTADYQVVAWQTKIHGYDRILKYAHFLKQPLTLGMFVPCDVEGNVLEEPEPISIGKNIKDKLFEAIYNDDEVLRYEKTLSKVIFKGFAISEAGGAICDKSGIFNIFWLIDNNWKLSKGIKTIEDLIPYNLDLVISF